MEQIINWMVANPVITLLGAVTLVQITPIKVDPWAWLMKQLRNALVGELQQSVTELTKDFEGEKVATKRWRVLDFADAERSGRRHSKEQWEHCINELSWYEKYCHRKQISNGVMEEAAVYLRAEYQQHLKNNDFLM